MLQNVQFSTFQISNINGLYFPDFKQQRFHCSFLPESDTTGACKEGTKRCGQSSHLKRFLFTRNLKQPCIFYAPFKERLHRVKKSFSVLVFLIRFNAGHLTCNALRSTKHCHSPCILHTINTFPNRKGHFLKLVFPTLA